MALLQQHYQNTHASAVMRAAQKISEDCDVNLIDEQTLANGGSFSRMVTATGRTPLKVTIAWTDPAAPEVTPAAVDPATPVLVNDLDLRITRDAATSYPWSLDRSDPILAATRSGENNVDTVEQVCIDDPQAAAYTITVDHDGTLASSQPFSLIISGIDGFTAVPGACSADLVYPEDSAVNVPLATTIEWRSVNEATGYFLYFGTDGGGVTTPTNIVNETVCGTSFYGPELAANTTYYIRVIPMNSLGQATGCNAIWSFTTENCSVETSFPFSEDFEGGFTIGGGNDWQNGSGENFDWSVDAGGTPSSDTGPDGDHSSGAGSYLYTEASDPNYPNKVADLYTPVFDLSALSQPELAFWCHMYGEGMGDLVVDIYGDGYWHYGVLYKAKQQSDDGDDWQQAVVDLTPYQGGAVQQIRFRVVTNGWSSDVAIDDVSVYDNGSFDNLWEGNSSDWNTTSNWSLGVLPSSSTAVEIPTSPSGGNFPICSGLPDAYAESVMILGGGVTISAGKLEISAN